MAVIFDLDGTLLDFEGPSGECLDLALRGVPGVPDDARVTHRMHLSIIGMTKADWSRKLLAELGIPAEVLSPDDFATRWFECMSARHGDIRPMPGAEALVERLAMAKVPMAIATSSSRDACTSKLSHHPWLTSRMQHVVCGEDVARGKPNPDIFLEAARLLGVSAERCVVFEDSPLGVRAGVDAGMATVAVLDPRFAGGAAAHGVTIALPDAAIRVASLLEGVATVEATTGVSIPPLGGA